MYIPFLLQYYWLDIISGLKQEYLYALLKAIIELTEMIIMLAAAEACWSQDEEINIDPDRGYCN